MPGKFGRRRVWWRAASRLGKPANIDRATPARPQKALSSLPSTTRSETKTAAAPRPIVGFPEAAPAPWDDPPSFKEALDFHMRRHGDTNPKLLKAVVEPGGKLNLTTIAGWRRGTHSPRSVRSLTMLGRIEQRYRLPAGYFRAKLPHPALSVVGHDTGHLGPAERRLIAWHLPDDYNARTKGEQEEILAWIRRVMLRGSTDFRQFHAKSLKQRFSVQFPDLKVSKNIDWARIQIDDALHGCEQDTFDRQGCSTRVVKAAPRLSAEMAALVNFKTSTLTPAGLRRTGVWSEATVGQKVQHLGLMFGAMVAPPDSPVKGLGIPLHRLCFGLLAFRAIWDWYLIWRERRRGFYTKWEIDMLDVIASLTRAGTGWMRQHPRLAEAISPVDGLISRRDINAARRSWDETCEAVHRHALTRIEDIRRVAKVHRDPFEAILPVLEANSPLGEYRKIADEVLRLMPDERQFPVAAAEATRAYLMLRLAMHLGLRQKNLRELLVSARGSSARPERLLTTLRRGELRWKESEQGWEVFVPAVAFKNAGSTYFGCKPFRLCLRDFGGLSSTIESYIDRHRKVLLRNATDPGTFFVKMEKRTNTGAAYDYKTFYDAWRVAIARYGIFNPYTGRGAISGILPHGPHNVRDVLATHVLKMTGSYELASYAIQDTPRSVTHYGRFLPHDKAAMAAKILNQVWETG